MRYVVLLEVTSQPDGPPPGDLMAGIMELGAEATRSGALLDTAGLAPSALGALVTLESGRIGVIDGPFAETKELISYAVYDVRTREEAVEWSTRFLQLHAAHWPGWEGAARVLKVFGPDDFGPPAG
jgi:hypothetical protein